MKHNLQLFNKKAATVSLSLRICTPYDAPDFFPLTRSGSSRFGAHMDKFSTLGLVLQRDETSRRFSLFAGLVSSCHATLWQRPAPTMTSADSCPITLHVAT